MSKYIYNPANYTPEQVDAGQRKINFALTEADRKLVAVLLAVKNAISGPPGQIKDHVSDIQTAIDEASEAINKVAEIIPPGCDPKNP